MRKGRIYKIISGQGNECYVGSTFQLISHRWRDHKYNYTSYKKLSSKKVYVYDLFDKYGVDNCSIILIKEYDVYDRIHMKAYEQLWINKLNCINKLNPFRIRKIYTKQYHQQYYQQNKDKIENYRKQNKDKHKEYDKQYYKQNKDKHKEYAKQYRELNKDKLREYNKQYREINKDKLREYDKQRKEQYYAKNKNKINERNKQYYEQNKDKIKELQKRYIEKNKEEINRKRRERRNTKN